MHGFSCSVGPTRTLSTTTTSQHTRWPSLPATSNWLKSSSHTSQKMQVIERSLDPSNTGICRCRQYSGQRRQVIQWSEEAGDTVVRRGR